MAANSAFNSTNTSSSVNIVRKALKISTNFDSIAAKQMSNYKHSKAQEMFKERNKKLFVDESPTNNNNGSKSNNFIDSGHSYCSVPVEFLEDGPNQRNSNKFENRREVSSSSTPFVFQSSIYLPERYGDFGKIPSFNPHVPPPIYPPQMRSTNSSPNNFQANNNEKVDSTSKSSTPNSSVPSKKRLTTKDNKVNKEVKKEVVEEVVTNNEDDIPSFQSPPELVNGQRMSKSAAEFCEDEKNKKKQALLWSLCQEELTVQSSIINEAKKIETIRKKIDFYQNALSNGEVKIQELKQKAEQLAERRKELLMSACVDG